MRQFLVRGRVPRPAAARWIGTFPGRLRLAARAVIRNTGKEAAAGSRDVRVAALAATNNARIVAVLLLLAAVALALEMAASFHLI